MTSTTVIGAILLFILGVVFGYIASGRFSMQGASSGSSGDDDLKKISGVGPGIEKKLKAMRITSYAQIATWTAAEVKEIDAKLNFKGRVKREKWISQAKTLASGGETKSSKRS